MLLYHLFGSMALSIIVLTLIVRLALFPLTLKQLKSTKATQAIQPLIADVRKKYKDQKEQYAAMQAIYKEYGVNPVAGCLPSLIQLPILYGLFFALRECLNDMQELLQNFFPPRERKNNGGGKTSTGDKRKDTQPAQKASESSAEAV